MPISVDEIVIQMQVSNGSARTQSEAPPPDHDALTREYERLIRKALDKAKER
jgi:hypothetical protein